MERVLGQRGSQITNLALLASAVAITGFFTGAASALFSIGVPVGVVGILFIFLIWVTPELRFIPQYSARVFIFPFVFSALSVPAYYAIILPGLPWISVRRLCLICLAIPTIITVAGSSKHRARALDTLRFDRGVFVALISFLASFCLAAATSTNYIASAAAMSVFVTAWALPFIAILMFLRPQRDTRRLMALLCICNFVDFGLGLVEFQLKRPFLIYLLPSSVQARILASADTYVNLFSGQGMRNGLYRAASTFNVSLSWGEMAAMLAPLSAYFAFHGEKMWIRGFGVAGVMTSLGSIVCSGSRGAYVAFFGAMAIYIAAWTIRFLRTYPHSIIPLLATAIISIGAVAAGFAVIVAGVGRRYLLGGGAQQGSTDARLEQWHLAEPKILMRPWGSGPGTASVVVGYAPYGGLTLDSYFITGLIDYGIIGFAAWFLVLGLTIAICLRVYVTNIDKDTAVLNALGCSLIAFLIYRLTLSQQENMTTMCVILAMALVTIFSIKQKSHSQKFSA